MIRVTAEVSHAAAVSADRTDWRWWRVAGHEKTEISRLVQGCQRMGLVPWLSSRPTPLWLPARPRMYGATGRPATGMVLAESLDSKVVGLD
jgi:hypothetical protein